MSTVCLYLEVSTACPRCQQPIVLNGASESVLCSTCQTPMPTPPDLWQNIIADELGEVTGFQEKEGRTSTKLMGAANVSMKYGRLAARCAPCKTTFPDDAFAAASLSGQLRCASCSAPTRIRRVPDWLAAIQPLATWIVGETLPAVAAAPDPHENQVVSIHCIQCGAPLQIDGKERAFSCAHCGGQVYLPDDLWLRLHPAKAVEAWFIVLDLGTAVGILSEDGPNGVENCRAFVVDPAGNLVLAYHADDDGPAGHRSRLGCFDRTGRLLWVQDGIEFGSKVDLIPSPFDGNFLLVDRDTRTGRWIQSGTGQPIRTIGDRSAPRNKRDSDMPPADAVFDAYDNKGVAIDYDGSILVLRRWGGTYQHVLRRFAPDGRAVPLWPAKSARVPSSDGGWAAIPEAPQAAPDGSTSVTIGWDGFTYFVGKRAIAKLTREGRLLGIVAFPEDLVDEIVAFGADRSGIGYALFRHAKLIGDDHYYDVLRVGADGRYAVWIGPHVFASPSYLSENDDEMAVTPDGTLFFVRDSKIRIIAPTGATLWQSPKAVESLKYERERLQKNKTPKRVARDLEG
jgi:DNA-directed RNA polymerase subunit RPC12/RpoP